MKEKFFLGSFLGIDKNTKNQFISETGQFCRSIILAQLTFLTKMKLNK